MCLNGETIPWREAILAVSTHGTRMRPFSIRLDRFTLPARDEIYWLTSEEELLWIFLSGRGSLCVEGAHTHWQYHVESPMAVWVPPRLDHGFRNTSDGEARGVVVATLSMDSGLIDAGRKESSPVIISLADLPQRCMVSFVTRTILSSEKISGRLQLSELQTVLPGGSVPEHVHVDRAEVCYVLCGAGLLRLDDHEQEVRAGHGMFIPPGERHCVINRGEQVLEYVIAQFGDDSDRATEVSEGGS